MRQALMMNSNELLTKVRQVGMERHGEPTFKQFAMKMSGFDNGHNFHTLSFTIIKHNTRS